MNQPSLRERFIRRLFPCARLDPPETGKVVTNLAVEVRLSLADRFRLALSGRCEVYTKAVVEGGVATSTSHRFVVLPPEAWGADPPPPRFPATVPLSADSSAAIAVNACEVGRLWVWGSGRTMVMARGVHPSRAEAEAAARRALRGIETPLDRVFTAPVPADGILPTRLSQWEGASTLAPA